MSYERVIGFGVNSDHPKAEPAQGRPHPDELVYFEKMGVKPIFISLKEWMPEGNREPEQKLFLPNAQGFNEIRRLIGEAQNAGLIVGQNYEDKNALASFLIDTPCGRLDRQNYSLRYRFEMDPMSGEITQGDFNEKSAMKTSKLIGGCVDRFERELEQEPGQPIDEAYRDFVQKYRNEDDRLCCDSIPFENLRLAASYICARNEVGIFFKHPKDNVIFVFEACEDFWQDTDATLIPDKNHKKARYHEWEIEPKQVWGELPERIKTSEQFKEYLYGAITMFRDYFHLHIPGSSINLKSKAEITKENIELAHNQKYMDFGLGSLSSVFEYSVRAGGSVSLLDAVNKRLENVHKLGHELYKEKGAFNKTAIVPSLDAVGAGTRSISANNDNSRPDIHLAAFPSSL